MIEIRSMPFWIRIHVFLDLDPWVHRKFGSSGSRSLDKTFRLINADKSDQFVPNVINDIYIPILIFVRSETTEKKVLNISSDIFDKTFRFISVDTSDQFIPKVSNNIYIQILRLIVADKSDQFVPNVSKDIYTHLCQI